MHLYYEHQSQTQRLELPLYASEDYFEWRKQNKEKKKPVFVTEILPEPQAQMQRQKGETLAFTFFNPFRQDHCSLPQNWLLTKIVWFRLFSLPMSLLINYFSPHVSTSTTNQQ